MTPGQKGMTTTQAELVALAAKGNLVCVRCSKWKDTPEELAGIAKEFRKQGVETEVFSRNGNVALFRVMDKKLAQKVGWLEDDEEEEAVPVEHHPILAYALVLLPVYEFAVFTLIYLAVEQNNGDWTHIRLKDIENATSISHPTVLKAMKYLKGSDGGTKWVEVKKGYWRKGRWTKYRIAPQLLLEMKTMVMGLRLEKHPAVAGMDRLKIS